MPCPKNIDPRLWILANSVCEGTITESEMIELENFLDSDQNSLDFYVDFIKVNTEILWLLRDKSPSTMDSDNQPALPKQSYFINLFGDWKNNIFNQDSPLSFMLSFVAVSIIGLAIISGYFYFRSDNKSAEPFYIAHVSAIKDCVWSASSEAPSVMESLQAGRHLTIEKGLVEITYANKARVMIEGPASYTVDSPKSGLLDKGKLFACADTEQSRQFTIYTPNAKYVDLGTEFGVEVIATGHSKVAVFSGKVTASAKLSEGSWAKAIPVTRGEAVVCEGKKFTPLVAQRSDFPSMQPLPPPPPKTNYRRWLVASGELQSRQDLIAYYDFQPDPKNTSVLLNRAPTGTAFNGVIQKANWVQGRFTEKQALEFMEPDSGVRVNLPGEYRQMTVIAWINNKQFTNGLNGILMSDDWDQAKKLHLQIDKNGKLILNVSGQVSMRVNEQEYHATIKAIPADYLSNWCMIAGVIDSPNQCTIYVNGEFFETLESTKIPSIRIGSALIGAWNRGNNPSTDNPIRNFSGRIDEMMIFRNILSAEEIKQIYESGKPENQ